MIMMIKMMTMTIMMMSFWNALVYQSKRHAQCTIIPTAIIVEMPVKFT
jgi:hypothetical protein